MVLIPDGNSEIGVHVWSEIGILICIRYLFRSMVDTNLKLRFFSIAFVQPIMNYHPIIMMEKENRTVFEILTRKDL